MTNRPEQEFWADQASDEVFDLTAIGLHTLITSKVVQPLDQIIPRQADNPESIKPHSEQGEL